MKKQMKITAILLAVLMLVNILPISAVADIEPTEPESTSGTSQAETDTQPEQTEAAEEPESSDAAEEPDPEEPVLPAFASKDGAGLQSANPPPSGSSNAVFSAAADMVGGTFSDSAGIVDSGESGKSINQGTVVRLYPIPDDGYAFKEWQIVEIGGVYSLEAEDMTPYGYTYYQFTAPGCNKRYFFEIRAVFEQVDTGYPIVVNYTDTTDSGCYIEADKTDVKVGETVTVTVHRVPGVVPDT